MMAQRMRGSPAAAAAAGRWPPAMRLARIRKCIRASSHSCHTVLQDEVTVHVHEERRPEKRRLFVFGLTGYCALGLCNVLHAKGWDISGTFRSASAEGVLAAKGWRVHRFDPGGFPKVLLSDEGRADLLAATHVLCSTPPLGLPLYDPLLQAQLKLLPVLSRPGQAGADLAPQQLPLPSQPQQQQQQQQAQQPQQRQPPQQQHLPPLSGTQPCLPPLLVYLSSTGVYGDAGGDWVDESSEPRPSAARGAVRLEAEAAWRRSARDAGLPLAILRLGGIYGPGRSALDAAAQAGLPSSQSQQRRARQRYTARVHVWDICAAVEACLEAPPPLLDEPAVYNIVDDEPAPRGEVVAFASDLLGLRSQGLPSGGPAGPATGGGRGGGGSAGNDPAAGMLGGGGSVMTGADAGADAVAGAPGGGGGDDAGGVAGVRLGAASARGRGSSHGGVAALEGGPQAERNPQARNTQTALPATDPEPAGGAAAAAAAAGTAGSGGSGDGNGGDDGDDDGDGAESSPRRRRHPEPIEEKRVRNARLKGELGVELAFPTYREGLSALAGGDLRPFEAPDLDFLLKR